MVTTTMAEVVVLDLPRCGDGGVGAGLGGGDGGGPRGSGNYVGDTW